MVEGLDQAISPRKAQMCQNLTFQRAKPMPSALAHAWPPARIDSSGEVCPYGVDRGLDTRKMAPGTAFHHAAACGASIPSHMQGFLKSVEKSARKTMSPHMAFETTGTYGGFLPRKIFPKKVYLLEIHVNK